MIRILMLDLGDTLTDGSVVFPHVKDALEAISDFEAEDGNLLLSCLVSDSRMPTPPPTNQKINAIFREYVSMLDDLGLEEFFQPVEQRATLSAHAGVSKPDRRIFEVAIGRLGVTAGLDECLFITERADHITACRGLGMEALQFGVAGAQQADFSDWSEAPLLISHIVNPDSDANREAALKVNLASKHDMEVISMGAKSKDGRIRGRAKKLHPIPDPKQGEDQSIYVPLPVDVEVTLNKKGRVRSVESSEPDPEIVEETKHYVHTLEANKQLARDSGPPPSGATHKIETDEKGRKHLTRKKYTAVRFK